MLTARINLEGTKEGDLLLSALVEKAKSYRITINDKSNVIIGKGKASFTIETSREANIMSVNASPEMPTSNTAVNARIDIYRKKDVSEGVYNIVATLDEPYIIDTDIDTDTKRLRIENWNIEEPGTARKKEPIEIPKTKTPINISFSFNSKANEKSLESILMLLKKEKLI